MNKRRERERDRERGGTAMDALSEERNGTSNDGDERARDAEDRRAVRVVGGVGGRLARRGSVVGGGRLRGTAAGTGRRGRGDLRGLRSGRREVSTEAQSLEKPGWQTHGRRCNLGGRGDESRGGGGVEAAEAGAYVSASHQGGSKSKRPRTQTTQSRGRRRQPCRSCRSKACRTCRWACSTKGGPRCDLQRCRGTPRRSGRCRR